jgi:hypothetical protein
MKTNGLLAARNRRAPGVAPLRAIKSTRREEIEIEMGFGHKIPAVQVIHSLECGHEAEPLIRVGCRQPYPPKRRRCKKCLEARAR